MTTYIWTKDVAKLIRAELKAQFPGVRFSVRCSTGTASAWIGVSYEDGPTYRQTANVAQAFEGRKFNGMTDGYDDQDTVLIEGEGMPEEVRYCCDGVNVSRSFTAAAHLEAQRIIATNSNVKDSVICDETGVLVKGNLKGHDTETVVIGDRVNSIPWLDAYQAVDLALSEYDLTPTRTK